MSERMPGRGRVGEAREPAGVGHVHDWSPATKTHAGWYVRCRHPGCDGWFSTAGSEPPTSPPAWMRATADCAVVVPPMQAEGQRVASDVIYPQNVPSNTVDARPPKEADRG